MVFVFPFIKIAFACENYNPKAATLDVPAIDMPAIDVPIADQSASDLPAVGMSTVVGELFSSHI